MDSYGLQISLGDLSSVVQLGVGLHAGTALLQSVAEFASTPTSSRLERLAKIAEVRAKNDPNFQIHLDTARDLLSDLEVKKIQFFNEYRQVFAINTGIAIALGLVLAAIALLASQKVEIWVGFVIVPLSLIPAPASLAFLWYRWSDRTAQLKASVNVLHSAMFAGA
jgi:hypothetical protein